MKKINILAALLCLFPTIAMAEERTGEAWRSAVEAGFTILVNGISSVLFYDIGGFPFIVLWLLAGGIFFTLRLGFINLRLFPHALKVVRGGDHGQADGEISPFQALCSAIAGTVGLGSIAGVSVAVAVGGPGAIFWIVVGGFLGMASKYAEVVLSLSYRKIDASGKVFGGPFQYMRDGLAEIGFPRLGRFLAIMFGLFCLGGAFGGGNMFQSNQSVKILTSTFEPLANLDWLLSLIITFLVGIVVIGSIKRFAVVADKLTPIKGLLYLFCCLTVIAWNIDALPASIALIFKCAFTGEAAKGGFIGMLAMAFKRAFFANEAGLGSAPTTHATSTVSDPVRAGVLALLEPFFAAVIAVLTGLTVVVSGAYASGTLEDGVLIAGKAFATVSPFFSILLAINVFLYAYGCILGWSYYGEIAWSYVFGRKTIRLYQLIFCTCTFLGGVMHFGLVLDFSDLLILGCALPNLIAVYMLSPRIVKETKRYLAANL